MSRRVQLYDATLRDGMGGGGMSLTAQEKVRVVHRLDELGIDLIEAGFPSSNPKEQELFELLAGERLEHAEVVGFGMTRRRGVPADADEGLRILAESFAPVVTLVGKSSVLHVEKVVRVSREENLAMIAESIAFLVAQGKRALLDAEHFFDGWRDDPQYALACVRAAAEAGAERVVLCDTNGGSLPSQVDERAQRRRRGAARRRARHPHARRRRLRGGEHARRRRGRARRRCRARSTASASARATRTSSRSSPTCS